MLPIFLVIAFLVGSSVGSPLANQYVESVLNTALRNELRALNLDPAVVPGFVTEFQDKVAIIGKVKGKAEYEKGTLTGLGQVRRFTECQGPYYSFGTKSVNCTVGFDNLQLNYEGKLKYGKMPKVSIKGKANVTTTLLYIEVSSVPNGSQGSVKNFMFTQIGKLDVKFTGLGPLNKYTKFLEDGYKAHAQAEIFNSMSQRFQYALNRAFSLVPMPN
ncbi:uncharacterized protein LOC129218712 [Uloborus diversus]|uniref:uncharacterized protein LOC129218712 n=1 Tax=Uloborus diversus TaxID=327109 RepID=UPI0024099CA3|nr:uncharacterized protein LOC129218712 [Uloborus diversus]